MSFERGIPNYWVWLLGDPSTSRLFVPETWGFLWGGLAICLLFLLLGPFLCFVVASFQYGPSEAFYWVTRSMFQAVTIDLPRFSLRRTLAIARLAMQEAIRNRVLVGFAVFVIVLLFAGLFLDVQNSNPARVYLSFVLNTTNYLVLLMALFLSAFSLPNDIKNRTIYTVVTKPVRAGEIVFGRTLGFVAVGTAMLLAMGLVSYVFVRRGLAHEHQITASELTEAIAADKGKVHRVQTTSDAHHRHMTVEEGDDGKLRTGRTNGHWHDVEIVGEGANAKVRVGPPRGSLIARAPVFGRLKILDKAGNEGKGISVGDEWNYRGYIEGGTPGTQTKAAAIWTFEGVTPERFPNGLPIELTLRVFRSYKGDIERGILGEIVIRNPLDKNVRSGPILFTSKEFVADFHLINNDNLKSETGDKIDLFRDLVHDGKVEVEIRCVEPAQYFGVATADCYLRPADSTFELNFAKSLLSIWLQMVLVTSFGVTFSTFLSGAVAMMATLSGVILGFFGDEVRRVATGQIEGGGPLESFIRIVTQQNVQTELEGYGIGAAIIQGIDGVLMYVMWAATYVLPDFNQFSTSEFVADGYSIMGDLVAQQLTMAAVYTLAITIVGYFFLKTREIAA